MTTDAKAQERQEMEFWDWWQGTSSFETRREAAHAAWQARSVELSQARERERQITELCIEMRTEIGSKSTPVVHEAATLHWLVKLNRILAGKEKGNG